MEGKALINFVKEGKVKGFKVVGIEGGNEIKTYLTELGIQEGVNLSFQGTHVIHEHYGPLHLLLEEGKELILGQGMAAKVTVSKDSEEMKLLELEAGEKAMVKKVNAGKEAIETLQKLGFRENIMITMLGHVIEEKFSLRCGEREIELYSGEVSKIVVEKNNKPAQLNALNTGDKVKILEIIGGVQIEDRLEKLGLKTGEIIELVSRQLREGPPRHAGGVIYLIVNDTQAVSLGHGMAEKVLVNPIS